MNQTEVEGNIRLEIVVTPSEGPECQQGEAMSLIQIATYQLSHSTVLNTVVNTQQSWARKATFATIRQHIFCIISDRHTMNSYVCCRSFCKKSYAYMRCFAS